MNLGSRFMVLGSKLFPEKIYQHREDNAQDDGCGQGEVEGEILLAYKDVPGQTPQPGDLWRDHQDKTDGKEHGAQNEKEFGEMAH